MGLMAQQKIFMFAPRTLFSLKSTPKGARYSRYWLLTTSYWLSRKTFITQKCLPVVSGDKMKYNILFGGKAGQGANILTHILAESLAEEGYYVFYYRDYRSLIRGGHGFNVLTFSDKPVHSHESKYEIIVALDKITIEKHSKDLKKGGVIIDGKHENMYFAGRMYAALGLPFSLLDKQLKKMKRYNENLVQAKTGYAEAEHAFDVPKVKKKKRTFSSGSVAVAEGAVKSGIDNYFAYPMTPSTAVLGELAQRQKEYGHLVLELENEVAVANAGAGSAITGAKTMIGTSGGGFCLMTEALSMCGIAEIPLVFYLAQRAGPASGVATYNAQADLHMARHAGHGEFPRLVLAPGDPVECQEITSQIFALTQKFGVPGILVLDKHIAESFYTTEHTPKIMKSKHQVRFGRFNSYEKDPKTGSGTEEAEIIQKNVEERKKKWDKLRKECEKCDGYKIYGKKNSKNCIVFWGSPKGAILDAIKGLDVCAIQILFVEPFPKKVEKILKSKKNIIAVENNATGQLCDVIRENTGVLIPNKDRVLRFDARPFRCDELNAELRRRLK
jgi:2-oxoglutarate ferredoxin oxidoreductase subunit alpha